MQRRHQARLGSRSATWDRARAENHGPKNTVPQFRDPVLLCREKGTPPGEGRKREEAGGKPEQLYRSAILLFLVYLPEHIQLEFCFVSFPASGLSSPGQHNSSTANPSTTAMPLDTSRSTGGPTSLSFQPLSFNVFLWPPLFPAIFLFQSEKGFQAEQGSQASAGLLLNRALLIGSPPQPDNRSISFLLTVNTHRRFPLS